MNKALKTQIKEIMDFDGSEELRFITEKKISTFTQLDFVYIDGGLIRAMVSFHYEEPYGLELWQFMNVDSFFPNFVYNRIIKGIKLFNDGGVQ